MIRDQRSEVKARVTAASQLFRSPCTWPHNILCHWMTSKLSDRDRSLSHSMQLASEAGACSVEGRALQTGSYLWYRALCELPFPQEMGLSALASPGPRGQRPILLFSLFFFFLLLSLEPGIRSNQLLIVRCCLKTLASCLLSKIGFFFVFVFLENCGLWFPHSHCVP